MTTYMNGNVHDSHHYVELIYAKKRMKEKDVILRSEINMKI